MITQKLEENNTVKSENHEIYRYGFQQGLTILLNVTTIIAIGLILGMIWQIIFFLICFFPLRSYAGGYHANTAVKCYIYSMLMITVILLAIKYLPINNFICVITFILSSAFILILSPIEDANKPLDKTEHSVYKRRAMLIWAIEAIIFGVTIFFNWVNAEICLSFVFATVSILLCVGKFKNVIRHNSIDNKFVSL